MEEPAEKAWVGVKVEKVQASTSGRLQTPSFKIYIGKILDSDDGGVNVSLLKTDAFCFLPDVEDSSYPVHKMRF